MSRRISTIAGLVLIWADYFLLDPSQDPGGVYKFVHVGLVSAIVLSLVWWVLNGINILPQWDRRPVLFLGGTYWATKGPGPCFIEPLTMVRLADVSLQDQPMQIEATAVQTSNNISLDMAGVYTWRVQEANVKHAVVQVGDVRQAVSARASAIIANYCRTKTLNEILHGGETLTNAITDALSKGLASWGVESHSFELKRIKINDPKIERSIALKAEAEQEGEAEAMKASYQLRVAEQLKLASKLYDDPLVKWLKELEVINEVGRNPANTIFMPSAVLDALTGIGRIGGQPPIEGVGIRKVA